MAKKKNEKKDIEKNKTQSAGIIQELKKVSWPNAEELSKATAAVIFLVVTVALIIFASDSVFHLGSQKVKEKIIEKQKSEINQIIQQNVEKAKEESENKESTNNEEKAEEKPLVTKEMEENAKKVEEQEKAEEKPLVTKEMEENAKKVEEQENKEKQEQPKEETKPEEVQQ